MPNDAITNLIEATEKLIEYMLESHEIELTSQHHGDTHADGEAPEACSYCLAIDEARQAVAGARHQWTR